MSAPIDTDLCTYETCSILIDGFLSYRPTLAGNAVLLAIFSAFLIAQIALGIRYKTWTFLVGMIGGTALEIVGYIGRVMLYQNVFSKDNFVIYLVGLTIGPAFYSAAIYVCLARIIRIYGASLSFFKPKIITAVFICCDVVSLILQAAGGAIVSVTDDKHTSDIGLDIMIAGLAFQVVTTTIFIIICLQIVYSVRKYPERINVESESLRLSRKFKLFSCAIPTATIAILIRCIFRVAELKDGFHSSLANDEPAFMVLDGVMMVIAVAALTFAHPGLILGSWWLAGKQTITDAEHARGRGIAKSMQLSSNDSSRQMSQENHGAQL